MSYNGIGLSTAKGSSTNGYIQKNFTRRTESAYERRQRHKKDDVKRDQLVDNLSDIKDKELLIHDQKRSVDLKVSEYRDKLEDDDDLDDMEIEKKCKAYREELLKPLKIRDSYKKREDRIKEEKSKQTTEVEY